MAPGSVSLGGPLSSSPPALAAATEKGTVDSRVCHDFNVWLQYAYTYKGARAQELERLQNTTRGPIHLQNIQNP